MSRKRSRSDLDERRSATITAARNIFLRYGYVRTTMAELATAAHLSRPSLYEFFPSKEELFAAVVHQLSEETLDKYRSETQDLRTLGSKLHRFCGDWATHGIRLTEQHPDAKDLFDLDRSAVQDMFEAFVQFLVGLVSAKSYCGAMPLTDVIRNLVYSFIGLEKAAHSQQEMEQLVRLQVDIFLASFAAVPKEAGPRDPSVSEPAHAQPASAGAEQVRQSTN